MDANIVVNPHIRSIDQNEAIKMIKRKITDIGGMKITGQKRAVRSGYDMDILLSDIATYGSEAKNLLHELQGRNERMFLLTFIVLNFGDTKRKLDNAGVPGFRRGAEIQLFRDKAGLSAGGGPYVIAAPRPQSD